MSDLATHAVVETEEALRRKPAAPGELTGQMARRISPELRQQLIEVLLAASQAEARPKMTYEEFLAWADEDTLAEWVDGEVIMTSPASDRHQDLMRFLTSVLSIYIETHDLGVVRPAPFQMKLEHGREPDLIFLTQAHMERLKENRVEGPADLVVEIVSLESMERDRGEKFYEYARGGVPEYWLIDPQARWAEFYRLKGSYYRPAFSGEEGVYRSEALPGFWLRVEWLWQEPLPPVEDTLLEIGGEAHARRWIERLRERGFLPPETKI
jgi:Uma2 family endonuclease